ncbi:hypothetical protein F5B22DRAFT_619436 [Xylaria bambusicola]|uniref:uncharacterized protein n=1 Tax=Xylaria bambusicola TaxID=326684 RepID=UPI002007FF9A|nr:uncharacterized protein F5B22DRAFT_619436 [Xylaria bambusicola]KAI0508749.1 hypothetical protein F5B22DRAFT_619436 [Xylaria bambusicola]
MLPQPRRAYLTALNKTSAVLLFLGLVSPCDGNIWSQLKPTINYIPIIINPGLDRAICIWNRSYFIIQILDILVVGDDCDDPPQL